MLSCILLALIASLSLSLNDSTIDTGTIQIFNLSLDAKTYLRPVRCQGFNILSKNLPVNITVQSQTQTLILVSDRKHTACDKHIFQQCDKSSRLCLQSQIQGISSYSVNQCVSNLYVYVYLQYYKGGFISVEENDNAHCNGNTPPSPVPVPDNPSVQCANLPFQQCGVRGSTCNLNCYRLECSYYDRRTRSDKLSIFCINSSISTGDWDNQCQQDYDFKNGKNRKAVGYYCNRNPVVVNFEQNNNGGDEGIFWELLEWLFWLALLAFIGSVVYYRYMVAKTGNAPWNPPRWVPDIVYPRGPEQGDPLENYRAA